MSTSSWTYVSEVVPCWDWSSRSEVLGFHFCKENRWKPGQSSTTSTGAIACRCVWPHKDASPSWKGQGARAQGGDHLGNDGGGSKLCPSPTLLQICRNYTKTMVNERLISMNFVDPFVSHVWAIVRKKTTDGLAKCSWAPAAGHMFLRLSLVEIDLVGQGS